MMDSAVTDYAALEQEHTSGFYKKRGVTLLRGEGATLWDSEGNAYVDCIGGLGVCTLGHGNKAVAEAIAEQAQLLLSCPESFSNDKRARFSHELTTILPKGLGKVFFCNSGTEANEAALKLARLSTKRTKFVATARGFHGRTFGALSVTHEPKYRAPFEPLIPGVTHIPYNSIERLEEAVTEETAAVILEPVQGEGGVHPAVPGYQTAAREITRRKGALLIMDEVQSGFGRTGRWFGCEKENVLPDMITMAKAIAAGVPMGAVAFGETIQNISVGAHGATYGGNPLSCAAGLASLAELKRIDAPRLCREKGDWLLGQLRALESQLIREVRGEGLWIGLDLKVKSAPLLAALQKKGVLCPPAGLTVVRFLPPAVITEEQLARVVQAVREVLEEHGGEE